VKKLLWLVPLLVVGVSAGLAANVPLSKVAGTFYLQLTDQMKAAGVPADAMKLVVSRSGNFTLSARGPGGSVTAGGKASVAAGKLKLVPTSVNGKKPKPAESKPEYFTVSSDGKKLTDKNGMVLAKK
jgi:hypothetical protein